MKRHAEDTVMLIPTNVAAEIIWLLDALDGAMRPEGAYVSIERQREIRSLMMLAPNKPKEIARLKSNRIVRLVREQENRQ